MEDYKKKYEEALERARKINSGEGVAAPSDYTICETIFPELKESEDERIRKELISFITDRKNWFPKEETKASWIAWLEKQKEANNKTEIFKKLLELVVKITSFTVAPWFNKESFQIMKEDFSNINETLHLFTIEELKSFFGLLENTRNECIQYIENEKSLQCIECMLKRKDEQKPAWSEKDEEAFHCLKYTVKRYYDDKDTINKYCSWLKSLKERMKGE